MKPFMFSTDWHGSVRTPASRVDDYCEAFFTKVTFLLDEALRHGCDMFLGGDIFHFPVQPEPFKNRLMLLFKKYQKLGVQVYGIPGNHDVPYYNMELITQTTLGLFFTSGMIRVLRTHELEDGWKVVGHPFNNALPDNLDKKTIMVGHGFLASAHKDPLNYSVDYVKDSCKARFLCLGHDHNQYPPVEHNGTIVVRPGALTRGSSTTENQIRVPSYALITPDTGSVEYIPVPHAPYDEIFQFQPEEHKPIQNFDDIRDFIETLKASNIGVSPYEVLRKMELKMPIYRSCVGYLEECGLFESDLDAVDSEAHVS